MRHVNTKRDKVSGDQAREGRRIDYTECKLSGGSDDEAMENTYRLWTLDEFGCNCAGNIWLLYYIANERGVLDNDQTTEKCTFAHCLSIASPSTTLGGFTTADCL